MSKEFVFDSIKKKENPNTGNLDDYKKFLERGPEYVSCHNRIPENKRIIERYVNYYNVDTKKDELKKEIVYVFSAFRDNIDPLSDKHNQFNLIPLDGLHQMETDLETLKLMDFREKDVVVSERKGILTIELRKNLFNNADAPLFDRCDKCKIRCTTKCSGCKFWRYCSKECQKLDWKRHRTVCKTLKESPIISNLEFK